jgi:hypothetical protein
VLGTVPYYCGHEGPRRDVHALALTLAELLTGEAPDPERRPGPRGIPPPLARVLTTALRADEHRHDGRPSRALREADDQPPTRPRPSAAVRAQLSTAP